jgi:TonB family protein
MKIFRLHSYTIIASLTLHILVLFIIFVNYSSSPSVQGLEKQNSALIAYIYKKSHVSSSQTRITTARPNDKQQRLTAPHTVSAAIARHTAMTLHKLNQKHISLKQSHINASSHSQQLSASLENNIKQDTQSKELLALLHAAIQKEQRYPSSALQMERVGRTTVEFILNQDGSISHLRMIQSSGTTSLDEAALSAIQHAAPFQYIQSYLHSPQMFHIDVVFET